MSAIIKEETMERRSISSFTDPASSGSPTMSSPPAKETVTVLKTLPNQLILVVSDKYWHCLQCNMMQTFDSGETLSSHLRQNHQVNIPGEEKQQSHRDDTGSAQCKESEMSNASVRVQCDLPPPKYVASPRDQRLFFKRSDETGQNIQSLKQQFVQTTTQSTRMSEAADVNRENNTATAATSHGEGSDLHQAQHTCKVCRQDFATGQKLLTHISRYSKLRRQPVQCKVCDRTLHTLDQLNIHIFSDHLTEQQASCLACGTVFENYRKLASHIIQRPGMHPDSIGLTPSILLTDARVCTECEKQIVDFKRQVRAQCTFSKGHHKGQSFQESTQSDVKSPEKIVTHVRKSVTSTDLAVESDSHPHSQSQHKSVGTFESEPKTKKCIFCNIVLSSDRAHLLHILNVHGSAFASEKDVETANKILMDDQNPSFTIEVENNSELETVNFLFTPESDTATLPTQSPQINTPEKSAQPTELFACSTCGEVLTSKALLKKHSRAHTQSSTSPSFSCDQCGRHFLLKENMEKHRQKHLAGMTPCKYCGKKFLTKEGVRNHEKNHHETADGKTGHFPHRCDKCPAKFFKLYMLHDHKATVHEGVPKHRCEICCISFTHTKSLRRHMEVQHEGSLPYKCDTCGERFAEKKRLTKHLVVHTGVEPYQCSVCSKPFMSPYSLSQHMQRHSGDRPFACDHCNKSYVLQNHLNRHKKTCKARISAAQGQATNSSTK